MTTACVFSLDDSYVMPFQVFYHSLEATGSIPTGADVYVIHTCTLSQNSRDYLSRFLAQYRSNVFFRDASNLLPPSLPIQPGDHVSPATFYRLFVADILPDHITKAVYLDSDMLAIRSVESLFTEPVESWVAAVDHCSPPDGVRLWGERAGNYFQAGVLVIPLSTWRHQSMSLRFLEVLNKHASLIKWWDQDVLNLVLANHWQRLPLWCNVCPTIANLYPFHFLEARARIIHYAGSSKPWNSPNPSPFTEHWDQAYEAVFHKSFVRNQFLPTKPSFRARVINALSSRFKDAFL